MKTLYALLITSTLAASLAAPAWSSGLMDSIKSQAAESLGGGGSSSQSSSGLGSLGALGGAGGGIGSALGLPSISSGTADNAAGVLQYCIENKYLGGSNATSVKDQLLSKVGIGGQQSQKQDAGYQQGLSGVLSGGGGSSFDLNKIKSDVKEKVCGYVLDHASSLL